MERYKKLMMNFKKLNKKEAKKLDLKIISYIEKYENANIKDISFFIKKEVKKKIGKKNSKKLKVKCKKIAGEYLESEKKWIIQEYWFNVFACVIAYVPMVVRIINNEKTKEDIINFVLYLGVIVIWIIVMNLKKTTGRKASKILKVFSHDSTSIMIFCPMLFYFAALYKGNKYMLISVLIGTILLMIFNTFLHYKIQEKI